VVEIATPQRSRRIPIQRLAACEAMTAAVLSSNRSRITWGCWVLGVGCWVVGGVGCWVLGVGCVIGE
jgi:hypothetical protein